MPIDTPTGNTRAEIADSTAVQVQQGRPNSQLVAHNAVHESMPVRLLSAELLGASDHRMPWAGHLNGRIPGEVPAADDYYAAVGSVIEHEKTLREQ